MDFIEEQREGAVIKVFGVGGCGGNVVNTLVEHGLEGADFVALNTDLQALSNVKKAECVQLGAGITRGLGAGAKEDVAEQAARQDADRIRDLIEGTDMLFITAGMGGGTGTGAAPVVAELAKELGVLTIAVVTRPFAFESREAKAKRGISNLAKHVDSLIVIPNDRLSEVFGTDMNAKEAFQESDKVLQGAVSGICEVIYKPGFINVDFADVRTVMMQTGMAIMGSGSESGVDRASRAAHAAVECPLLEDHSLSGAKGLLINVTASEDTLTMQEIEEIQGLVKKDVNENAEVIFGTVFEDVLGDELRVTVIATGLDNPHVEKEPEPPEKNPSAAGSGGVHAGAGGVFASGRAGSRNGNLAFDHGAGERDKIPAFLRKQIS